MAIFQSLSPQELKCQTKHYRVKEETEKTSIKLFYTKVSFSEALCCIVPGKHPPPNFASFVVFRVIHVTAKFVCSKSKCRSAELT